MGAASVELGERCLDEDLAPLAGTVAEAILDKLALLAENPEFGKPLGYALKGYRRITYGQYRMIYRYHAQSGTVFVVSVGLRREGHRDDIYEFTHRLLRAGRLEEAAGTMAREQRRIDRALDRIRRKTAALTEQAEKPRPGQRGKKRQQRRRR